MIYYIKRMAPLVFVAVIMASSCTETKSSSKEETEINTMDSTSRVLKDNTEKLEAQTKKVEESIEKLDDEFEENN